MLINTDHSTHRILQILLIDSYTINASISRCYHCHETYYGSKTRKSDNILKFYDVDVWRSKKYVSYSRLITTMCLLEYDFIFQRNSGAWHDLAYLISTHCLVYYFPLLIISFIAYSLGVLSWNKAIYQSLSLEYIKYGTNNYMFREYADFNAISIAGMFIITPLINSSRKYRKIATYILLLPILIRFTTFIKHYNSNDKIYDVIQNIASDPLSTLYMYFLAFFAIEITSDYQIEQTRIFNSIDDAKSNHFLIKLSKVIGSNVYILDCILHVLQSWINVNDTPVIFKILTNFSYHPIVILLTIISFLAKKEQLRAHIKTQSNAYNISMFSDTIWIFVSSQLVNGFIKDALQNTVIGPYHPYLYHLLIAGIVLMQVVVGKIMNILTSWIFVWLRDVVQRSFDKIKKDDIRRRLSNQSN